MESFRALAATVHRGSESARPHVGLYQSRYGLLGAADAVWCSIGDHTDSTRQGLAAEASLFTDRYHCDATTIEDSVLRVAPLRRIRAALKDDPVLAAALMRHLAQEVERARARPRHCRLRRLLSGSMPGSRLTTVHHRQRGADAKSPRRSALLWCANMESKLA